MNYPILSKTLFVKPDSNFVPATLYLESNQFELKGNVPGLALSNGTLKVKQVALLQNQPPFSFTLVDHARVFHD